jgi:hypothetical protein
MEIPTLKFQQDIFSKTVYFLFEGYFAWRFLSYAVHGPEPIKFGSLIIFFYIISWLLRFASQMTHLDRLYNKLGLVFLLVVVAWVLVVG